MRNNGLLAAWMLVLAGCAQAQAQDSAGTAEMPLNPRGGPELSQDQAIGLASWALKAPANTAGDPARAARAIAAEDWLAGQTILYGDYNGYAPGGQPAWASLRAQARAAIGIAPDAPSREVVSRLLAASEALAAGRKDAALTRLSAPIFHLGPDGTLSALAHLPPLPARDTAFTELGRNLLLHCGR